jgi:hypothetical protein
MRQRRFSLDGQQSIDRRPLARGQRPDQRHMGDPLAATARLVNDQFKNARRRQENLSLA